jgi:ATP-dependent RNA helicase DeaD
VVSKKTVPVTPEAPHTPPPEKGMERYRIEVGNSHGLRPKDVVGAISNEAGLDSRHIGQINIEQEFSFVDLPFGMPGNTFQMLKKTWVRSRRMAISRCA